MLVLLLWLWLIFPFFSPRRRRTPGRPFVPAALLALRARKPDWVIEEIVRLKALMSEAGCRRIADTFNRLHASRHRMTVSKTWVAMTVRRKRLAIEECRRVSSFGVTEPAGFRHKGATAFSA